MLKILRSFSLLLFTFFWQFRFAPFGKYQTVDYLIPWIYLSDLLIIFILVSCLSQWRSLLDYIKNRSRILTPLFLFLIVSAFSNLPAVHPFSAWYHYLKLWEMALFAVWAGWSTLPQAQNDTADPNATVEMLLQIFIPLNFGLLLESFIAIGEWFKQASLGLQFLGEWRFSLLTPGIAKVLINNVEYLRPYATFPHPNVLGGIMAIMAAVNLWMVLFRERLKINLRPELRSREASSFLLFALCFLLFTTITFLSFSRSAWFTYCILVLIILIRRLSNEFRRTPNPKLFVVRFSSFILILFFALLMIFRMPPGKIILERFTALKTTDQITLLRRSQLNQAALAMLVDKPLLGVGLGQFVPNLEKYSAPISGIGRFLQPVHNLWLLIAAETGIVGFLSFLFFIVSLVLPSFKSFPSLSPVPYPLLTWLGIFLLSFTDHYFWTLQAGVLFFWLTVGLTLNSHTS